MVGVKEILRLWLLGHGQRDVGRLAQADRKTVARYVDAAQAAGSKRGDPEDKLTDELLAEVIERCGPGVRRAITARRGRPCAPTKASSRSASRRSSPSSRVHGQLLANRIPDSLFNLGPSATSRGQ